MRVAVLLSTAGGGDRQPLIALSAALRAAGHDVAIVCDTATVDLIESVPSEVIAHEVPQTGFITRWAKLLEKTPAPPNPFMAWAHLTAPAIEREVAAFKPDVVVGSLFCLGLLQVIGERLRTPTVFVNPSFYFGPGQQRSWEEDWHGSLIPRLAHECFLPLVEEADLVLHATDPIFDVTPADLPDHHHYVGFLLWEPPLEPPDLLAVPGDPFALVTASTARPADEERMLDAAVSALADAPVRTVLTLPKPKSDRSYPAHVHLAGYTPHSPILERSALSINQAGHGIVSKCLRAGVPMVLVPWDADQPGVAARAEKLGVAITVPKTHLSPEALRDAVGKVLESPQYRERAAEVRETLSTRSPEDAACTHLEELTSA